MAKEYSSEEEENLLENVAKHPSLCNTASLEIQEDVTGETMTVQVDVAMRGGIAPDLLSSVTTVEERSLSGHRFHSLYRNRRQLSCRGKRKGKEKEMNSNMEMSTIEVPTVDRIKRKEDEVSHTTEPISFQYFLDLVGTSGPWNYLVFLLCATYSFVSPFQSLSYQFLGDTPDHWCHIPELVDANWTDLQILRFAVPFDNATGKYDGCLMRNLNYSSAAELGYEESLEQLDALTIDDREIKCPTRDFNLTDFPSTVVTEWDLVCNRRFLYSTTFSASFFVRLFTSPFTGFIIDAFGRRLSLLVSLALFIPSGLLQQPLPTSLCISMPRGSTTDVLCAISITPPAAELGYEESLEQLDALTIDDREIKCPTRDFNLTDFPSTVVTEWDLVCNRRFLYSTTFSASFFVRLFTSPFTGFIIDAFGRRLSLLVSLALFIPSGLLAAASTNFVMYLILRILVAQFDMCCYMASYVLCLELSGKSQRSMLGVLFSVPWALGYMALPGVAYLIREWRFLQLALMIPALFMVVEFWLLPESPRWLVLKGRHNEALKVLRWAAKVNKRPALKEEDVLQKMQAMQDEESEEGTNRDCSSGLGAHTKEFGSHLVKLVKSWPLLRLTLVVMYCWFASSATYYGISLNAVNLSANVYLYMFFGGLLELPSYILLWPLVSFLGRKWSFISLFVACGAAIVIIPILDEFAPTAPVSAKVAFSLLGKMAINMAFQLAFLYTANCITHHTFLLHQFGAIFFGWRRCSVALHQ
ncbi:beta-alanine transporter-like [Macrobrachium nipponense]|uniref:beta-alanine transporter-like n=1 Tax=Macrobrachium nipponense TaxID=159736 RepID=UPI0030C7DF19